MTASPIGSPVSEDRPLGTSTETTDARDAFIISMTSAFTPVTSLESPVPISASTMTSALSRGVSQSVSSLTGMTCTHIFLRIWRYRRAVSLICALLPHKSTATLADNAHKYLAMTKPSPPLLPVPQTTTTDFPFQSISG